MSVGEAPFPFPMGRITPTPDHWNSIIAQVGMAPMAHEAPLPTDSLPLQRWRNPRFHMQLEGRGCCVGESIADMLELNTRIGRNPKRPPPLAIGVPSAPSISPLFIYSIARQYSAKSGRPISGDGAIVSDALLAILAEGVIEWKYWPGTAENYRNYRDGVIPDSARNAPRIKVKGEAVLLTNPNDILYCLGVRCLSVVVGTGWRGGQSTNRAGEFQWGGSSIGGHAYNLTAYAQSTGPGKVCIDNSWDNAGWGVQPARGAADSDGNILPRGFGFTNLAPMLSGELSAQALSSGQSEAVFIEGLDIELPPEPVPTPPIPTPTPVPPPAPPSPTPTPTPVPPEDGPVITLTFRGTTYGGKLHELK